MRFSVFNDALGLYDVFDDGVPKPINSDMPTPSLPREVNGIGVPAIQAGRPVGAGARHVGQSWHPVGSISNRGAVAGYGDTEAWPSSFKWGIGIVAVVATWLWWDKR